MAFASTPDAPENAIARHDEDAGQVEGEAAGVARRLEINDEVGGDDGDLARNEEAIDLEHARVGEEATERGGGTHGHVIDAEASVVHGHALVFDRDDISEGHRGLGNGRPINREFARAEGHGVEQRSHAQGD